MTTTSTTPALQTAETLRVDCSSLPTESWPEFNPDLPDIPTTDVIREHDDLAMASHGCGFWVLDYTAPLRQAQPGITECAAHLFDFAAVYRSANGVVLSWWLGEEVRSAADATLEIMDTTGDVVRITPAEEGVERDPRAGPALPLASGLDGLRWDLRTDPPATFPDMICGGVRTMSPAVPPGTYAVRLTVDGWVTEAKVEVRRNPWITDVTDEELVAQYKLGMRIRDRVDAATSAVIANRRVKPQLDEGLEEVDDEETLIATAERLRAAASAVEAAICQVRSRSSQGPLNSAIEVTNRLANVLPMSERGVGRLGSGMYAVFEIMVERLEGLLGELEEVWGDELAEVNTRLREMEVEPRRVVMGDWVDNSDVTGIPPQTVHPPLETNDAAIGRQHDRTGGS